MADGMFDGLGQQHQQRAQNGLTPEYVKANSGHKLLCWKCRSFQRTSAEWVPGPLLRIRCKVCGTHEDFAVSEKGFVLKTFREQVSAYTKVHVRSRGKA